MLIQIFMFHQIKTYSFVWQQILTLSMSTSSTASTASTSSLTKQAKAPSNDKKPNKKNDTSNDANKINKINKTTNKTTNKTKSNDDDNDNDNDAFAPTILPDAISDDAALTFESIGVDMTLFDAPFRALKWTKPTKIQAAVLPAAFAKSDIIALAETGSGCAKRALGVELVLLTRQVVFFFCRLLSSVARALHTPTAKRAPLRCLFCSRCKRLVALACAACTLSYCRRRAS